MKEESNNNLINNNNIDQFDNENIKLPKTSEDTNINKENIIKNIRMKKIIQIKNKKDENIPSLNNNEIISNKSIKINLNTNTAQTQNIGEINKIYKNNLPKLNEYFNHDINYDNELSQNILPQNDQYFLNKLNYNRKINQINIPSQNYPNIITNNNNYYYSILDDFPINMPIYINNTNPGINSKNNEKIYNIKTIPNYINTGNYFRNNFIGEREFINCSPNINMINRDQIRQQNYFNKNNMNEFYNKEMFLRNKFAREYSSDYLSNRSRFLNSRYPNQNQITNVRMPIYILPTFRKRARSHERPFNIIHKYYDGNFIVEEENEEETNIDINKEYKNEDKENIKKNVNPPNNGIKNDNCKIDYKGGNHHNYYFENKLQKNEGVYFNNYQNWSKIRLLEDLGVNNNVDFFSNNKTNHLFHNNINSNPNNFNLVYERKSIHKKLVINNTPEKNRNKDINNENEKKKNR